MTEHYVTLFDAQFLPVGLCLHESLARHGGDFHLWVVCMDDEVLKALTRLRLDRVSPVPVGELETPELLQVKAQRSRGEYCWTLTPFVPGAILDRAPDAHRVTYVDADLYFFETPDTLFAEFEASGKHVQLTEHAYDPEYDCTEPNGRFCVQFLTFRRSAAAQGILEDWQRKCIEWCFDRVEPGRFGDQKYLDAWPARFPDAVHVLSLPHRTLGPWNARLFFRRDGELAATFYHFHGFRLVAPRLALLFCHFEVGRGARAYYRDYAKAMRRALRRTRGAGIEIARRPLPPALRGVRAVLRECVRGRAAFGWI